MKRNLEIYLSKDLGEELVVQKGLWIITKITNTQRYRVSEFYLVHGCERTIKDRSLIYGLRGQDHRNHINYKCAFCGRKPPENFLVTFNLLGM